MPRLEPWAWALLVALVLAQLAQSASPVLTVALSVLR